MKICLNCQTNTCKQGQICAACRANHAAAAPKFRVRYCDYSKSRTVWEREFFWRSDAEEFAKGRKFYSAPAVVTLIVESEGA